MRIKIHSPNMMGRILKEAANLEGWYGRDFAGNLATEGIDLISLAMGAHLTVGDARLVMVQVGKDPSHAHTYNYQGYSILPKQGIFCKVVESGKVKIEDSIRLITD